MVEVEEEQNDDEYDKHVDFADKVPGEDDEPDMGNSYGDEELVPMRSKGHGGLFGADIDAVKY